MKKKYLFIVFIILIIVIFIFYLFKDKSYSLNYDINDFNIKEDYNDVEKRYYFNIKKDKDKFDYVVDSKKLDKKVIKKVIIESKNDYSCLIITSSIKLPVICKNKNGYVDSYIAKYNKVNISEKIKSVDKINVYNDKYSYYIWNGYGITDLMTKKEYNFIKKETYDNNISYTFNNYVIFADYNSKRTFNKFYIFNSETKKIREIKGEYDISFNSYFNGNIGNKVYLFDIKNKNQYEIDLDKNKINSTLTSNGGICDYNMEYCSVNKLSYKQVKFNQNNTVNYKINNDKLYMYFKDSKIDILISNNKVKDIIGYNKDKVYYVSDDELFLYDPLKGEVKLLENFEWNFSYLNKIYVF